MVRNKAFFIQGVEDLLNQVDPSRENVRQLRHEELSNGDTIDFYQFKGIVFLIQGWKATGGFEVYAAAPGGRIDVAAKFVVKTEELRGDMDKEGML